MSIGSILNAARSGMNAQQIAVQIASQNIANAQTAGYSRQRVELATTLETIFPYGTIGTGVEIQTISRARDSLLDATYRENSGSSSKAETTSHSLMQIQQIFGEPSDNGLSASLDAFWSAWNDLASDPTSGAAKAAVRQTGNNISLTLNRFARQLDQLDQTNRESMNADVGQINVLARQIGQFNQQIVVAESNGNEAGDLRDARDRLLDQISDLTGGQIIERGGGTVAVYIGGRIVVDGTLVKSLEMQDGQPPTVVFTDNPTPLSNVGGSLGGKMDVSATRIPGVLARLDSLAAGLVTTVNAIHSAGKIYSGSPPVASAAGNFFDVTTPAPAGTDPRLTARGMRLATTLTGPDKVAASGAAAAGPGNNDTATALAGLREQLVGFTTASGSPLSTLSIGSFFAETVGDLATETRYAEDDATVQKTIASSADARRQSVSGVSTDEELMNVVQHQHAYQAAARLVSVVDDMTQTLIDLGR
jgi:flagellar hook-associated protein 1 FlgK